MSTDEPFDGNTTPGRDQDHGARPTRRTPIPGEAGADDFIASLRDGRYRLVERIGAGAIGQVWRAQDTILQREVAIKTINLATSADPSAEARFRREAVATAGLNHPNVVQIHDSGVDGHSAYIVMEFLHGPNLQTVVTKQGPIGWQAALPMLAQVAAGLGAAHRFGVTHRDVKPANVVLTSEDLHSTPKLVDFGIARLNDQQTTALTSTMTAIGSAAYMSPEQASGERVGPSSDMYSFGCLMMTVLTGQPPFPGESPVAVARAQVYDTPPLLRTRLPDAPASLEDLVAALLAKRPEDRPGADEVVAALNAIQGDPQAPGLVAPPPVAGPAADAATMAMSPTAFTGADADATAEGHTRVLPAGQDTAGSTAVDALPPVPAAPGATTGTPTALVTGGGALAAGTGTVPAETGNSKKNGRGRRIALAIVILAVLAGLIALAWTQGRKSADPAPSQTVTQTQTATPTTATPTTAAPTTAQSYDTSGGYATDDTQQNGTGGYGQATGNGGDYPQGGSQTYDSQGNQSYYPQQPTATGDSTQAQQGGGTGDGFGDNETDDEE
ncbi:serine/threonine-protein kinase [Propionibacterium australiense]|uniref:non-specific serine/threonine protein kinase n=1 Tax=Propionibacterium australiense TaxID=119981 RepID=A0A383S5J8_9ACTN|nr:serine/threonine-protein kinase [Propionibacterium australiense]SYZ33113.1 non-specific serine/threonine protein kinase [Propionibacterium australiense]VEH89129.1 Serine/threonine-protein kinase pknB [Propionibacterium australiense]